MGPMKTIQLFHIQGKHKKLGKNGPDLVNIVIFICDFALISITYLVCKCLSVMI